jgi:hypothetical protein
MSRNLSKVGFCIELAALLLAGSASAVQVVGRESAEMAWAPASGPVYVYGVFVSRNGEEFPAGPEQFVWGTSATIRGAFGQILTVQVAAFDADGNQGPISQTSEAIEFVASAEADPLPDPDVLPDIAEGELLFFADFQSYDDREDPEGWIDTDAGNSLEEIPALFETFEFGDGNVSFGTSSVDTDIHSHYLGENSSQWSSYEYSGRMQVDHPDGGIGVTLFSGYPDADVYYQLRRQGDSSFSVVSRGAGALVCSGSADTGVTVLEDAWYWFRFQAVVTASGTRVRARVWHEADPEPSGWQVDCVDDGAAAIVAGAPGVWSAGNGNKYWDDLEVRLMVADPDEGDAEDTDGDGWLDDEDNCSLDSDALQRDTDSDGFGNVCDCDYDNDGTCDGQDLAILGQSFGRAASPDYEDVDMDGNGVVDGSDFLLFSFGWGGSPGPSGLSCAGTVPCP